jgi:methylated-DNA-[protein]-cysteine S-methyltransferase
MNSNRARTAPRAPPPSHPAAGSTSATEGARYAVIPSPVGDLVAGVAGDRLYLLEFADAESLTAKPLPGIEQGPQHGRPEHRVLRQLRAEIDGYFSGKRRAFDVPLAMQGTPFQLDVWGELVKVPYGSTASYAEIARRVGRGRAVRAVGQANGRNPIVILVPCHRIVSSDGSLGGYSSGLDRKRYLLDLERRFAGG